jgi:hypothetical protein
MSEVENKKFQVMGEPLPVEAQGRWRGRMEGIKIDEIKKVN